MNFCSLVWYSSLAIYQEKNKYVADFLQKSCQILNQEIKLVYTKNYTPFSFPLMVDRLREKLSTEKIEDKIKKMKLVLD